MYQAGQGGAPFGPVPLTVFVPQGNVIHTQPSYASFFQPQPFLSQIQYTPYNTSVNTFNPQYNSTLNPHNSVSNQLQQPVPLPLVPAVPNYHSVKSISLSSSTLSIIPTLSKRKDWTTWNNAVVNTVRTISGLGYLFEGLSNNPLLQPAYMPPLPEPNASSAEWQAYLDYWQLNALVVQVLMAKLRSGPAAHIPSAAEIATERRTTRQIYQMLSEWYSESDYADGLVQKMKLWDFRYSGGLGSSLERYIAMWKDGIDLLRRCRYPYTVPDAAIHFILHGPMHIQIWSRLQSDVMASIAGGGLNEKWLDDFFRSVSSDIHVHAITQHTAEQVSWTQLDSNQNSRQQPGPLNSNQKHVCDDCNKKGYTRCSIDGADHCEHHHCPGGIRRPTVDSNPCPDATVSASQSLKTKVLAAVAAPLMILQTYNFK